MSIGIPNVIARFILGACVYMGIEVAFDNTSHRSMGLVGGIIFILCGSYDEIFNLSPYFFSVDRILLMLFIGITITFIEYFAGLIFNSDYKIWDYRHKKFNLDGQICLSFSLIWTFGISHLIIYLDNVLRMLRF